MQCIYVELIRQTCAWKVNSQLGHPHSVDHTADWMKLPKILFFRCNAKVLNSSERMSLINRDGGGGLAIKWESQGQTDAPPKIAAPHHFCPNCAPTCCLSPQIFGCYIWQIDSLPIISNIWIFYLANRTFCLSPQIFGLSIWQIELVVHYLKYLAR